MSPTAGQRYKDRKVFRSFGVLPYKFTGFRASATAGLFFATGIGRLDRTYSIKINIYIVRT